MPCVFWKFSAWKSILAHLSLIHIYNGLKPFKQLIVEGHIRIILVNLVKIHPITQEDMSFEAIVDDWQRAIKTTAAHFEPMNQVRQNILSAHIDSVFVIVLCFVVRYFMSILVLQSSRWGRESWLLCLVCLPGVSWLLCGSSSRSHGFVCSLWLWCFLIILAYYFWKTVWLNKQTIDARICLLLSQKMFRKDARR